MIVMNYYFRCFGCCSDDLKARLLEHKKPERSVAFHRP